jgi:photosystem II stability/assembly factor-like uncharacterized protein
MRQYSHIAFGVAVALATFVRAASPTAGDWTNISDPIVRQLASSGTKIPWPGQTGGIACDRLSGRVFLSIAGVGLWSSDDHGDHFAPAASGAIGGRCEFGYAMNAAPAGGRLACFMLDGKAGITLDGGKTWRSFADEGRGWDFGAVDWSDPDAKAIFANRHETDGDQYLSRDGGRSWTMIGKHPALSPIGIFNADTLVTGTDDGLLRSTDGGRTWKKAADLHPVGRVAVAFNGSTYWLAVEGLIVTKDNGATWRTIALPTRAGWGPLFGKDERQIVVADFDGFLETFDGGQTWSRIAPLPPIAVKEWKPKLPGQWLCIGFDPQARILYASCIGNPAFRLALK